MIQRLKNKGFTPEEIHQLQNNWGKDFKNGYIITGEGKTQHVERIDEMEIFSCDSEALQEAIKNGYKANPREYIMTEEEYTLIDIVITKTQIPFVVQQIEDGDLIYDTIYDVEEGYNFLLPEAIQILIEAIEYTHLEEYIKDLKLLHNKIREEK